jgi:hypothetical protein
VREIAVPEDFPELIVVPVVPFSILSAETLALVVPLIETWPLEDLITAPWKM